MAGMMRKGMSWLGLGPEEDYADYVDELDDHDDFDAPDGVDYDDPAPAAPRERSRPVAVARTPDPSYDDGGGESGAVRVLPQPTGGATHQGLQGHAGRRQL